MIDARQRLELLRRLYSADVMREVDDGDLDPSSLTLNPFCAICTGESGKFDRKPLGRNDALVMVCQDCDEVPPSSGRYGFDGGREASAAPRFSYDDAGRYRGRKR